MIFHWLPCTTSGMYGNTSCLSTSFLVFGRNNIFAMSYDTAKIFTSEVSQNIGFEYSNPRYEQIPDDRSKPIRHRRLEGFSDKAILFLPVQVQIWWKRVRQKVIHEYGFLVLPSQATSGVDEVFIGSRGDFPLPTNKFQCHMTSFFQNF